MIWHDSLAAADAAAIYAGVAGFTQSWPVDGYYVGFHVRSDGFRSLTFQGSKDALSWLLDLDRLGIPLDDPELGPVHPGFVLPKDLVDALDTFLDGLRPSPLIVQGHSRGAAQAALYAAHRIHIGKSPARLVLMGCPRPGGPRIPALISHVPVANYRNQASGAHDPVTDVPLRDDFLGLPYVEPAPFTGLPVNPAIVNTFDPFALHHLAVYTAGISMREQTRQAA